jgi:hypothetical protein
LAESITIDAFDLVGVAGTTRLPRTGGWWDSGRGYGRGAIGHLHPDGRIVLDDFGPPDDPYRNVSPVVSLDGVLLFGRRHSFLTAPFDERLFDQFHFYDSDLSLRWLLWHGRRLGVVHGLDVVHRIGASLEGWQSMLNRFHYRHGGFLPLSLSDVSVWHDNLAAMRLRDPTSAERLTAGRRPGQILSYIPSDQSSAIGKGPQGDVAIRDVEAGGVLDPAARWIVLQGAGNGEAIQDLLLRDTRPMVVIEPEAHLVCWLLCRFHWAEELLSGRLRWSIVAKDLPATGELALHEVIGGLAEIINNEGEPAWVTSDSARLHADFHQTVRQSADQMTQTTRRIAGWPSSSSPVATVTVISPRCRIFDDLAVCLNEQGCATRLLVVTDRAQEWTRTHYWHVLRQLREEPSNVTILRNRTFLEATDARLRLGLERYLPGRVVSWWWDEPTVTTQLDWRDPQCRRPAFAFAREIVAKLPTGSRWLPPAARSEFASQPLPTDDRRVDIRLSFVGQSRFRLLRDNLNILANALAFYVGVVGQRLADAINRCTHLRSYHDTLLDARDELAGAIDGLRPAFPALSYYLDYLRRMSETAAFRLAAVELLQKQGVIVFGDEGWVESGVVPRERFGGPIPTHLLADLYRRSQLNLNLNFMQVSSTVNPKVLDIAATGAAVLTDHRPELSELFPDAATRPPSFTSLDELGDLVSSLLAGSGNDRSLRSAHHVRSHHLMRHRARWLIRELELPSTPPPHLANLFQRENEVKR